MRRANIEEAAQAARRFLELAAKCDYEKAHPIMQPNQNPTNSPKLTGELRRASMDLTRRLAEMRKL